MQEPAPPKACRQRNGEWYYEEYAHGAGVTSLGLEDKPAVMPTEEERKSILDLFKR